jgi:ATP-binding protein involved in chromosome partitioning
MAIHFLRKEPELESLESRAKALLSELSGQSDLGLLEPPAATVARFLGTESRAGCEQIVLQADGLTLTHKMRLEKKLLQGLGSDLSVNFRRLVKNPASVQAAEMKPRMPYGIKPKPRAIQGVSHIIAVVSGKGGVGKSTTACQLALSLKRQGRRVGVLDADIYGPSIPQMFHALGPMRVKAGRLEPLEVMGLKLASLGFVSDPGQPAIWRGPMAAMAVEQLCYEVDWGPLDYLVIDMPPGTGDVQISLLERLPLAGMVLVTTPSEVALIDAKKAWVMGENLGVKTLAVVENMQTFVCSHCHKETSIFGEASDLSELSDHKVVVPLDVQLRLAGDSGMPQAVESPAVLAAFARLAELVASQLSITHP